MTLHANQLAWPHPYGQCSATQPLSHLLKTNLSPGIPCKKFFPNRRPKTLSNALNGENDHSIIRAVLAGDKEAYGALVVRHSHAVFGWPFASPATKRTRKRSFQEAFLRGYPRSWKASGRALNSRPGSTHRRQLCTQQKNKRKPETAYQIAKDADPAASSAGRRHRS